MTRERERTARTPAPTSHADVADAGPSDLLAQVRDLEDIARQAHESCVRGIDVERELAARRNASGE
jgi:hypothetical protein